MTGKNITHLMPVAFPTSSDPGPLLVGPGGLRRRRLPSTKSWRLLSLSQYRLLKMLAACWMIFALGFLTASNAFLYPDTEGLIKISTPSHQHLPFPQSAPTDFSESAQDAGTTTENFPPIGSDGTDTNNANNTAEERAESGNSLSEYLHQAAILYQYPFSGVFVPNGVHPTEKCLPLVFELNTPPPERA